MKKNRNKKMQEDSLADGRFAMDKRNIVWIAAGLLLMALGYVLMIGGGTKDPNVFTGDQLFSFRRIVLAPILIFVGFIWEIWAIMHKKEI